MTSTLLRRAWIPVALALLILYPLVSSDIYYQNMLIVTFMLAIGASGWNIMGGYAGYISLGNSVFIGLGAYTTGILAAKAQLSPFLGCLVGGLVCAVGAALLSLVTRRTRGMYFVIVTFAALQLLGVIATTLSGLTGGSQGLALPLPTWSLSYQDWPFYYPMLALLVITVAVSAWVRRCKLGMGLFAIQDDEDKAAGLGLRTALYKMIAFVLGGTFVGIAGGIYAYYVTFLNTAAVFDIVTSVLIVLSVLLGGRGTLWGPVLGAFIVAPISNLTSTGFGGRTRVPTGCCCSAACSAPSRSSCPGASCLSSSPGCGGSARNRDPRPSTRRRRANRPPTPSPARSTARTPPRCSRCAASASPSAACARSTAST